MMKVSSFYLLLIGLFFSVSCNTSYKAVQAEYSSYRIQQDPGEKSSMTLFLKPYSENVTEKMDVIIGYNEINLEKRRQANTLGYFMTDAYLQMANEKLGMHVDAAFMNSGGIRLPDLPAGAITQSKIFELMPFDNLMVVLKMKGSVLQEYLDTLAANDAIIQSGLKMDIKDRTVKNVVVGNKSLDPDNIYTIVHSDYVANNSSFLKSIKNSSNGYLLRDAIIDYIKKFEKEGRKIVVSDIDRISYVN